MTIEQPTGDGELEKTYAERVLTALDNGLNNPAEIMDFATAIVWVATCALDGTDIETFRAEAVTILIRAHNLLRMLAEHDRPPYVQELSIAEGAIKASPAARAAARALAAAGYGKGYDSPTWVALLKTLEASVLGEQATRDRESLVEDARRKALAPKLIKGGKSKPTKENDNA